MLKKILLAAIVFACGAFAATAQDAVGIWNGAIQAAFDATKSASVSNVSIERDRIRITLTSGTIQFSQPVAGRVFSAAFQGHGHLEISVPNSREAQQLNLFLKAGSVDLQFTDAVFNFSSDAFDELSRQLTWSAPSAPNLAGLYQSRMREWEEHGAPLQPRIVQSLLAPSGKRDSFLDAELKTAEHGWVMASFDARKAEEVTLGRWADRDYVGQFDTWLSFPTGTRDASDAFRDPLEKASFSIRSYQMHLNVGSGTDLSATSLVKIDYLFPGDRFLLFELNPNLRVDSVKDETGATLPYFQPREPKDRNITYGGFLAVAVPVSMPAGEHTFEFHYSGKRVIRNVGSGNYFVPSYGWYPGDPRSTDAFATRADFQLVFQHPKKLNLVATGDKVDETSDGKETTSTWKSPVPLAVAGFAFGDYNVVSQKVGDVNLEVYVNKNQDDLLASISRSLDSTLPSRTQENMEDMPDGPQQNMGPGAAVGGLNPAAMIKVMSNEIANTLRVFQSYFGPLPYDRLAVTNIPYSYGQGWPTLLYLSSLSFLDSTQRNALGIKDQIGISDYFRAHEVSHQWWGHRVGWKSYHDQWMSEGFAQFSGNLYVQFRDNPGEYLKRIRLDKQALLYKNRFGHVYESLGPVWMGDRLSSSEAVDGYDTVIYDKGGLILHDLRMMLQDTQNPDRDHYFKDVMQDFCKMFDNKAASTEDFKAVVEKHMLTSMDADDNHRMDWFFNQYVYGTEIPEYKLDYTTQQEGDKWVVSGTVIQSGVPDGWRDELRVYLHLPGKGAIPAGWLRIKAKSTSFKFQLAVKPDGLSLNDSEDTLAVIK
jgi:hypothetical protein